MNKLFRVLFVLLVSFSFSSTVKANTMETPQESWVVFATSNYFPLLEVTIASIHEFSTRPVIAVGVNADIPFSLAQYPRLIKKRIDVDLNARLPYFYKPQAILAANPEKGIYIDADAIVNKGCDALFSYCDQIDSYPLCPAHEDEAWVSQDAMDFFGLHARTMHYIHNDVMVFSQKCKAFLSGWSDVCLYQGHLGVPVWDETLLNVYLWKHGATKQLPIIDPYNAYFDKYLALSPSEIETLPYSHWYVFHGNKDPHRGWRMLRKLIEKHSSH